MRRRKWRNQCPILGKHTSFFLPKFVLELFIQIEVKDDCYLISESSMPPEKGPMRALTRRKWEKKVVIGRKALANNPSIQSFFKDYMNRTEVLKKRTRRRKTSARSEARNKPRTRLTWRLVQLQGLRPSIQTKHVPQECLRWT